MNFSTASNSAVRTSGLVTINNVYFEASTRSIVVYCADNTRRLCRIDRCETIEAARSLYKDAKALEGFDAFFSAAGGNDPRKWFFAVEGAPVYDDTPDVIFGMSVEEPKYSAERLAMGTDADTYWAGGGETVELKGDERDLYIAKHWPKEPTTIGDIIRSQMVEESYSCEREDVVGDAMVEVAILQSTVKEMKVAAMVPASAWHEIGMALVKQMRILQEQEVYTLSDMINDDVEEIIAIHASYAL